MLRSERLEDYIGRCEICMDELESVYHRLAKMPYRDISTSQNDIMSEARSHAAAAYDALMVIKTSLEGEL